jgi:hypothetical protein
MFLDFISPIIYIKLLAVQYPPPQTYFPSPYSRIHFVHVPLNMKDLVSQPYQTTGKIGVPYALNFIFLESRREDKKFWPEW